jgi:hypothetical protein
VRAINIRTQGDSEGALKIVTAGLKCLKKQDHSFPWLQDEACASLLAMQRYDEAMDHYVVAAQLREHAAMPLSTCAKLRVTGLKKQFIQKLGIDNYRTEVKHRLVHA